MLLLIEFLLQGSPFVNAGAWCILNTIWLYLHLLSLSLHLTRSSQLLAIQLITLLKRFVILLLLISCLCLLSTFGPCSSHLLLVYATSTAIGLGSIRVVNETSGRFLA